MSRFLLTGATGTIGRAVRAELRDRGRAFVTVGRTDPRTDAPHVTAEFAEPATAVTAGEEVAELNPDGAVLCAGVDSHAGIASFDPGEAERVLRVNAVSQMALLSRVVGDAPFAVAAASSDVLPDPPPGSLTYAMSKGTLETGLRALAREAASVTATAVRLPFVGEPMATVVGDRDASALPETAEMTPDAAARRLCKALDPGPEADAWRVVGA